MYMHHSTADIFHQEIFFLFDILQAASYTSAMSLTAKLDAG